MALRAQPRLVTRLNRRTLALLMGGLGVAVLDATLWSLQPKHPRSSNDATGLYNVDRVSKSEELNQLFADYSKLPQKVPELGPPLPGDLGPAIVKSQPPRGGQLRATRPGCGGSRARRAAQEGGSSGGFVGVLPLQDPAHRGYTRADCFGGAGIRPGGLRPAGRRAGLGINRRTIYRWLSAYHYGGMEAIKAKPIPGAPAKVNAKQMAQFARMIREKNPLQLKFEYALWALCQIDPNANALHIGLLFTAD